MKTPWRFFHRPEVTSYLVALREQGGAIRATVESLKPGIPPDASETEPDIYIWFESGHWIGFVVDEQEHSIYVTVVESPKN